MELAYPRGFAPEADIPTLLRKGVSDVQGVHLAFVCDLSTLRNRGAAIPLKVNQMGHYVLRVVACGDGPPRFGAGPKVAALFSE